MLRLLPVVLLAAAACGHHGDENLGLSGGRAAVDVAKLTEPDELARALSLSGRDLDERLGAHRMDASSSLRLTLPGNQARTLEDTFEVEADGRGAVHLTHDNSAGNGFEAVAFADDLYVKPRYGKFVRRKVEGDELARLRVTVETPAASYLRLLSRWLQIREAGTASVAGHAGVRLALSARSSPGSAPAESETGRRWRQTVKVRYIDGEVVVDARTGAALAVRLDASYSFDRDEKPIAATITFKQTTSADPGAIAPPADWATLARPRPMRDRQKLLEGLK